MFPAFPVPKEYFYYNEEGIKRGHCTMQAESLLRVTDKNYYEAISSS